MAGNSQTQSSGPAGRPVNFRNLSPFADSDTRKGPTGQGMLAVGFIGIAASIGLILCTLIMKA